MLIIITGGSGSGKSEFAEKTALHLYNKYKSKSLFYLATMMPFGDEVISKIQRHRKIRSGKGFKTIERYYDIEGFSFEFTDFKNSVILLECMSNLVANEIFEAKNLNPAQSIINAVNNISQKSDAVIIVTNEVFSDCMNYSIETLEYIKILAEINCILAKKADYVFEIVCGIPLLIKGGYADDY